MREDSGLVMRVLCETRMNAECLLSHLARQKRLGNIIDEWSADSLRSTLVRCNAEIARRIPVQPMTEESIRQALVDRYGPFDMTPEGYVRKFVAAGSPRRKQPWEDVFQSAGLIAAAEHQGYIRLGNSVTCPVEITEKGRALLACPT